MHRAISSVTALVKGWVVGYPSAIGQNLHFMMGTAGGWMRATCADQLELGGVEVGIRCYVLTTLRLSDLKRLASHSVWLQYLSTYW